MSVTIWKYPLDVYDVIEVSMPVGAKLLCVQMQGGQPCLWALVETDHVLAPRKFVWYGTGNPAENGYEHNYIGTVQKCGLVFHLFEVTY